MAGALTLFPDRVAIGRAQPDGAVYMTPEFLRALAGLFERVGGAYGMSTEDLGTDAATGAQTTAFLGAVADLEQLAAVQARAASLAGTVEALERQVLELSGQLATLSEHGKHLAALDVLGIGGTPPTDWEHPGKIGAASANSGKFTTLQATGKVQLNPAGADVEIKPTGAALVTIAPESTGQADNMELGRNTPAPARVASLNNLLITPPIVAARLTIGAGKTFIVSNSLTLAGGEGATLNIAGGGTLGSAAFFAYTAFAPAGGGGADWSAGKFAANGVPPQPAYAAGAAATDAATTQALVNRLRQALINNGICS